MASIWCNGILIPVSPWRRCRFFSALLLIFVRAPVFGAASAGELSSSLGYSNGGRGLSKSKRLTQGGSTASIFERNRSGKEKLLVQLRGGGDAGREGIVRAKARVNRPLKSAAGVRMRPGTMESEALATGNIQRIQFLRKRTGSHLGSTVFALYIIAIRRVIATVGQPLRSARARRARLLAAAAKEKVSSSDLAVKGIAGPAAQAVALEAMEPMPFPYLPGVGSMMLMLIAVAVHVLLVLGKRWSVRFHVWSSFDEVLSWREADAVLVTPIRHTGTPAICPLAGTPYSLGNPCYGVKRQECIAGVGEKGEESPADADANSHPDTEGCEDERGEDSLSSSEVLDDEEGQEGSASPRRSTSYRGHRGTSGNKKGKSGEKGDEAPSFVYQRRKFLLSTENNEGETFGLVELPVGWPLGRYLEAKGLTERDVPQALKIYGENSVDVQPPTFWQHLAERLTSPFVVFSLFNQVMWMLELYWLKAMVAIFEVLAVEAGFVAEAEWRRRQLGIRATQGQENKLMAWRDEEWVSIPLEGMVPGDLVSLKVGASTAGKPKDYTIDGEEERSLGDVPADMLLLKGTAVVNEASLTGESVPQIKTSLTAEPIDFEDVLDLTGRHSSHVLLSGTTLLDSTDGIPDETQQPTSRGCADFRTPSLPESTPDGGALCFVLRTGVYSFQGDLRRMIDFGGTQDVRDESKDAAYLLGFLVSFAAFSCCHVVREGLRSKQVSAFRLLVQCVRIISAVVPEDLSFELNQCLRNGVLSLQRDHALACTEPFRIPLAGKVDVCLFDKTGTITSDRLLAETLVAPQSLRPDCPPEMIELTGSNRGSVEDTGDAAEMSPSLVAGLRAVLAAEVVVAGCHSLTSMDGALHGDPLEASALDGIRWDWNATSHTARPRDLRCKSYDNSGAGNRVNASPTPDMKTQQQEKQVDAEPRCGIANASSNSADDLGRETVSDSAAERPTVSSDSGLGGAEAGMSVSVWRRHAFSSQLQRMSVVAQVSGTEGLTMETGVPEAWVLSKGSPETMVKLLDGTTMPDWYEREYDRLARAGRRVIALAHRSLGPSVAEGARERAMALPREQVEREGSLTFDGFLAFNCKTRADSHAVIRGLREVGGCATTIVTGDSLLTACHVAAEVGLISAEEPPATRPEKSSKKGSLGEKSLEKRSASKGIHTQRASKKESPIKRSTTKISPRKGSSGEKRSTGVSGAVGKPSLLLTVSEDGEELRWEILHPPTMTAATKRATGLRATEETKTNRRSGRRVSRDIRECAPEDAVGKEGLEFFWEGIEELARANDLCATGTALEAALRSGGCGSDAGRFLQHFRVLARMTPALKEELATVLIEAGKIVLMCGDGSNDVGALRRSHVGLALLSGFGDANTKTVAEAPANQTASCEQAPEGMSTGQAEADTLIVKSPQQLRKEERELLHADITEEFERLRGEGVNAAKAMWKASRAAQQKRVDKAAADSAVAESPFAASAAAMFKDGMGSGGEVAQGVVRSGDASLAAPFTSKKPSIAAVLDVVRQGRCTLAAVLHTYQMVALRALFSSYTNSVLYLMRVRWPTRPLIATSFMFQPLHLALASPRALSELSPLRPPPSVFHPSTFASLLGQAGVHVACMAFAVRVAKAHSPEEMPASRGGLLRHEFVPSLVSNAVFLLSQVQAVSVSVVNFKGRPFMRGILESRSIFLPVVSIVAFTFALALEMVPTANKLLQLAAFPSMAVKTPVLLAMTVSLLGPLLVDRLCVRLFDPDLHKARKASPPMGKEAKENVVLLGVLLAAAAIVVARTDFDDLRDTLDVSSP